VYVLSPFGNIGPGCDNAYAGCDPDPCGSWPELDQRHCGEDLQTTKDNGRITGPVHAIQDGYFCGYDPATIGSNFNIRTVVGSEVWHYQYTHVGPEFTTPGNAVPNSYIAAGVYLGNYGYYGDTEPSNLHLHLVNIVYVHTAGQHPCAATQRMQPSTPENECPVDTTDDCPNDPYRRVEYSTPEDE